MDGEVRKLKNYVVINAIFDDCKLSSTQKLVALGILKHRNITNFGCFPKLETIMKVTNLSRPAVRNAIIVLEKRKIFKRVKLVTGKRIDQTRYYFLADLDRQKEIFEDDDAPINKKAEYETEREYFAKIFY